MNKRAGSLETTLLKGSCCFPLQLRISGQAAIMAIENAIVAIVIHTLTYTDTHTHTHLPTVQTRFSSTRPWTRFEDWCMRGGLVLYETLNMAFAMCCHVATKTDSVSSKWPRAAPPRRLHRMAFGRCFPGLRNWTNLNKPFKHQTPRSFG